MPMDDVSPALASIKGESPGIREVRALIRKLAVSPMPVLIAGETGTGKELCAAAIFQLSGRKPFVPVNCAAIADNLIESELFGHRKGAFTGAVKDHVGLIGKANGGTLFLDEVTELGSAGQAKLLRALQSGEYRPVGSTTALTSAFRLLAATNADVDELVSPGRLRQDLLYRIDAARLVILPLRKRREDIALIASHLLQQIRYRYRRGAHRFTRTALILLTDQPWPGNVRQLHNVVERSAVEAGSDADVIDEEHLIPALPSAIRRDPVAVVPIRPLETELQNFTAEKIRNALEYTGGHRREAARWLEISEAKLYRLIEATRYDVPVVGTADPTSVRSRAASSTRTIRNRNRSNSASRGRSSGAA